MKLPEDFRRIVNPVAAWALYDFANTIFSAAVMTAYFPLYLTQIAGANWYLGAATTGALVLAGLAVPFLGTLSDRTGRTKTYLVRTTVACILFLFPLSIFKTPWLLVLFFMASCFFFHASLVFYNALLPAIAGPERQGRVSGLGVGLGYLGVVLALPAAHGIDSAFGRPAVFGFAAVLFLFFSLPLFFGVPGKPSPGQAPFRRQWLVEDWIKLKTLLSALPGKPALLLFLGGNFFAADTLNALIFWFAVYLRDVFGLPPGTVIGALAAVNFSAFLWGLAAGWLTDRIGASKTMALASASLFACLAVLVTAKNFPAFMACALTAGAFAIAGIWTAGRKVLIELAPEKDLGGYFGLYGMTTKISVFASLGFSILADWTGFGRALAFLLFPAGAGFIFLFLSMLMRGKTAD